jgi:ribose transport system ATP-binding protein
MGSLALLDRIRDRILVMHEGEVAGVIPREEFSEERVMALAAGMEETS